MVLLRHFLAPDGPLRLEETGLVVCLGLALTGCTGRVAPPHRETAYVRGAAVPLRDQLGPSSNLVGKLESGEAVEVLATRPRWAQVRAANGQTGWVQSRFLATQALHDRFRALAAHAGTLPPQGTALLRRGADLHLDARRDSETFYHLPEGEEVEVLAHRVAEHTPAARVNPGNVPSESEAGDQLPAELAVQALEDWFLVRASGGKAGWLLESLLDMNVPVEVARYREGLRIRAWFVIYREMDEGVEHPWYLWATIRPVAGLPFDFDEIRVFVWDPVRDRYETAYRERKLIGFYPVQVGRQETPRGPAPSFGLQLEDQTGKRFQKNYVMAGRTVRRAP